jgi:dethiobiotin synthetase
LINHSLPTADVRATPAKIIFITGTDTGVGKTVLTALLLRHLRRSGRAAFAMKPFTSGSRADAKLLHALQDRELTLNEINPFYFRQPVAPLVAAHKQRRDITLKDTIANIQSIASHVSTIQNLKSKIKNPLLLVEGAGGLLAPLGKGYSAADLIAALRCSVIVVARNQLGTLNHTLLTVQALTRLKTDSARIKVVLMARNHPDISAKSNVRVLRELLGSLPVISLPFLGKSASSLDTIKKTAKHLSSTCNRILAK